MDQGFYTCAPPAVANSRQWSVDDLVCLVWFDALCKAGMKRPFAGELAACLSHAIANKPKATQFNVYAREHDDERGELMFLTGMSEDPAAQKIFVAPVAEWRRNVRAAIKNFYNCEAVRNAKK